MNSNPALLTRAALVAAAASMIAAHAVSACEHDNALSCVRATFQQVGEPGYYPDLLSLDGSTVVGRIMLDESLEWPHGQLAFRWSRRGSVEELDTLGGDYSLPSGVSANGAVILGTSADLEGAERPFFWTKLTGMHELVLPGGNTCLKAILSPDGTVIAGTLRDAEGLDQAFLWSPCAFSKLGFLPGSVSSEVSGVSGNGQHVIGTVLTTAAETRPFLWSKGKRMRDLGACPHGGVPAPALVSADGKVVIGSEAVFVPEYAEHTWCWTARTGQCDIGTIPGADSLWPIAMSSDGSLMVGNALIGDDPSTPDYFEFDLRAFVWTPCGGVRDLGALPNSSFYSVSAVSADGVVVVGSYLSHENYMLHPFVWDRLHGLQDLRTLLVSLGVDLKDWDLGLGAGIGVAKNGREVVITGGGYHSNGTHHTWRVTLTLDRCHRRGCGRN